MFVIQKNIPLAAKAPRRATSKYAFVIDMDIGDSVLVKNEKQAAAMYAAAKHHNVRMARRRVDGGVRLWRVE